MLQRLKSSVRDLVPPGYQVPAKYWFGRVTGGIEAEMGLLPLLVRAGDRVVDVGGNRGVYLYRLAALGARVEVFEPNPACHATLSAWAARHRGIAVHAVALSASSGQGDLMVPVDIDGVEHDSSGSLERIGSDAARHVAVPLETLDHYGFTGITFIKIDVEGHEASVIAGAGETIAANRPALLVEIEQRHLTRPINEVFAQITSPGYEGFFLSGGKLKRLDGFDVARDQAIGQLGSPGAYHNNFLFLASEKIAGGVYARLLAA